MDPRPAVPEVPEMPPASREPPVVSAIAGSRVAATAGDAETGVEPCLLAFEALRRHVAGAEDAAAAVQPCRRERTRQAQHESLLAHKRELGMTMEELRSNMRVMQEDCERCSVEAQAASAAQASSRALATKARDELDKVSNQLWRSGQQSLEHLEACSRLRGELARSSQDFGAIAELEERSKAAVRSEVEQLRHVVADLEARLRAKSAEIGRLTQANAHSAEDVAVAAARWRAARAECAASLDAGPLGLCVAALRRSPAAAPGTPCCRQRSAERADGLPEHGSLEGRIHDRDAAADCEEAAACGMQLQGIAELQAAARHGEAKLEALRQEIRHLTEVTPVASRR